MSHQERESGNDLLASCRRRIHRQIATGEISAKITDNRGGRPILIVGEHERVSDVLVKAGRTDGCANLFVVTDAQEIYSADLLPAAGSIVESSAPSGRVRHDGEIGMLIAAARQAERAMNFSIALPSRAGEMRDTRQLQTA